MVNLFIKKNSHRSSLFVALTIKCFDFLIGSNIFSYGFMEIIFNHFIVIFYFLKSMYLMLFA